MEDAMKVFKEFFELPFEKKSHLYNTHDENVKCKLYTSSSNYENEEIHYWRDCLIHDCTPLKESFDLWPQNPPRYREVVGEYLSQVGKLGSRILDLISEGLGLESDFFAHGYKEDFFFTVNHYPPCPDPSLTLGLPKHCDPNVITLLLQDIVPGLQVCVDNEWQLVQPCPNAFVVNMGHQMQVISNGKLKGAEHRVVTNAEKSRTTASYFVVPSKDCILEPAKALTKKDLPLYKQFRYAEFMETYKALNTQEPENLLEPYKIKKEVI
uniref:Fe2OG dioxygenase domain-containing protein n=2 Tax=Chenopodium quinoa TaxID=63459 RepID=A0A803LFC8_CHEQI